MTDRLLRYKQAIEVWSFDFGTPEAGVSDERQIHYLHTTGNWGNFMKNRYLLRRFFAYYFDGVINFIILHIFLYIFNISLEHMSYIMLIFIPLLFCYYVFFEFFFGKTLGKKILRLQVDGFDKKDKVKLCKQVVIRNLFRFVPFDQISILFYDDNRMWHDMVSKTTVTTNYG